MSSNETIAVLGAGGTMGQAMARNLATAGHAVRAWNRTREKAEPLAGDGVAVCDTAAEAAEGATVVLTMLTDADATLEVAEEAVTGDALWLQMGTIGLEGVERAIALASERGAPLVDAPVLGTKQPAEQGKLVVLASGPDDARAQVDPIFDVVGQKTLWLGEAGNGSRMKLAANSWLLAVVEGAAETIALAQGLELDPHQVLEAFAGGPLDVPYLQTKGKGMIEGDFTPAFMLKHAAKDAALAAQAAERAGLELPALAATRDRMADAAREHGDEDMSAVYLAAAPAT